MDTWEFFRDAQGLWRWRYAFEVKRRVLNSTRSHPSRALAVADAKTRGYMDTAAVVDSDDSLVNVLALRDE